MIKIILIEGFPNIVIITITIPFSIYWHYLIFIFMFKQSKVLKALGQQSAPVCMQDFSGLTKNFLNRCKSRWHSMERVTGNWLQKYWLQLPTTVCPNCPTITITNDHYNITVMYFSTLILHGYCIFPAFYLVCRADYCDLHCCRSNGNHRQTCLLPAVCIWSSGKDDPPECD